MKSEGEKERKIIVEIGHGGLPIYQKRYHNKLTKDIKENEHYIGIDLLHSSGPYSDLSPQNLKDLTGWGREDVKGKIDFIISDGKDLPIADESVDHMIFKNVFGSGKAEQSLIDESARVLKDNGELEINRDLHSGSCVKIYCRYTEQSKI